MRAGEHDQLFDRVVRGLSHRVRQSADTIETPSKPIHMHISGQHDGHPYAGTQPIPYSTYARLMFASLSSLAGSGSCRDRCTSPSCAGSSVFLASCCPSSPLGIVSRPWKAGMSTCLSSQSDHSLSGSSSVRSRTSSLLDLSATTSAESAHRLSLGPSLD